MLSNHNIINNITLPASVIFQYIISLVALYSPTPISSHTHVPTTTPPPKALLSGAVEYNRYCFMIAVDYNPLTSEAPLTLSNDVGSGQIRQNLGPHYLR